MKKMGSFAWFPCLLPKLWSLNCQKLCPFCNFLYVSKKSKDIIAVYVYASESFRFAVLENGIVIMFYAMTLEDISA